MTAPFKVGNFEKGELVGAVSMQWASRPHDQRYLSLDDLFDSVKLRYESSDEIVIPNKKLELLTPEIETLADAHKISLGLPDGSERSMSHWCFGQLCTLAGAPAAYLRNQPTPNVADCLNFDLRHRRDIAEVKTFGTKEQLAAITGPDYGRIPDYEVVRAVQLIAGSGRGEARWKIPGVLDWRTYHYDPEAPVTKDSTTLYASDRDVFIFLVDDRNPIEVGKLKDGSPDLMFRGFYISNSEVGARALKLAAFYLRGVCMNRNLWGVEGFEELTIRHTKFAPDRFMLEARPALKTFSEGSSTRLIQGVAKAKEAKIARDEDDAFAFLKGLAFSKKRARDVIDRCLKEEDALPTNAWLMAQGITAVARDIPNQDDRLDMELKAKRILDKVA
jgi:hypothetical protein